MAKNQQIFSMLNQIRANDTQYVEALDTILKNGNKDVALFRQALIQYKNLWTPAEGNLKASDFVNTDALIDTNGIPNLEKLYQFVLQKHLMLVITHSTDEKWLTSLIKASDSQAIRTVLLNNLPLQDIQEDLLTSPKRELVTNQIAAATQQLARSTLLVNHIKALNTEEHYGYLENLLKATDNANLQEAAEKIGIPLSVAKKMTLVDRDGETVRQAALKHGLLLYSQYRHELALKNLTAFQGDADNFNKILPPIFQNRFNKPEDLEWAKGIIGLPYLSQFLIRQNSDILMQITNASEVKQLRDLIKTNLSNGDNLQHAVNQGNSEQIRQIAALQALTINIGASENYTLLHALANATTVPGIIKILAINPSLGFSGEDKQKTRELATKESNSLLIVAAANVRLFRDNQDENKLRAVLEADTTNPKEFSAAYEQHFAANSSALVKHALKNYWLNPIAINETRKELLTNLVSLKVSDFTATELNRLAKATSAQEIKQSLINSKMLSSSALENLIYEPNYNHFSARLRAYAQAELLLRDAKNFDVKKEEASFLLAIKHLDFNGLSSARPALASYLSSSEQAKLRLELIKTFLIRDLSDPSEKFNYLQELALSKDAEDFKIKLKTKGVEPLDWLKAEEITILRRTVIEQLMPIVIQNHSTLSTKAHSQLLTWLNALPLITQQTILTNPQKIPALINSKNDDELRKILGQFPFVSASQLYTENYHLSMIKQIVNPSLAQILSIFPVSEQQVKAINTLVISPKFKDLLASSENKLTLCNHFLDQLHSHLKNVERSAINQAFGLNGQGDHWINETIYDRFMQDQQNNQNLYDDFNALKELAISSAQLKREEDELDSDENVPLLPLGASKEEIEIYAMRAVLSTLMSLPKHQHFNGIVAWSNVEPIYQAFANAKDHQHLIAQLNKIELASEDHPIFALGWQNYVTEQHLNEFQIALTKDAWLRKDDAFKTTQNKEIDRLMTNLNIIRITEPRQGLPEPEKLPPRSLLALLTEPLKEVISKTTKVVKTHLDWQAQKFKDNGWAGSAELQWLANYDVKDWLNPSFQTLVKRQGAEFITNFKSLANACTYIVNELRQQQEFYSQALKALPQGDELLGLAAEDIKAVNEKQALFNQQLALIAQGLKLYEQAHLTLQGDPNASTFFKRKGFLLTLEEAQQAQQGSIAFKRLNHQFYDRPLSEKEAFLKGEWQYQGGAKLLQEEHHELISSHLEGQQQKAVSEEQKRFQIVPLAENSYREHIIEHTNLQGKEEKGCYIEERRGQNNGQSSKKESNAVPLSDVKLTVVKFPQDPEGRIKFAMSFACQMVAECKMPPSRDFPLVLKGGTEAELKYIWTALRTLGIKPEAIQIRSMAFNPAHEQGRIYGFSSSSLYENVFKKSPLIAQVQSEMKAFQKENNGAEKQQSKLLSHTQELDSSRGFNVFKEKVQQLRNSDEMNSSSISPSSNGNSH